MRGYETDLATSLPWRKLSQRHLLINLDLPNPIHMQNGGLEVAFEQQWSQTNALNVESYHYISYHLKIITIGK